MYYLKIFAIFTLITLPASAKDVVLDVRTAAEFKQGHTKSAINIDVTQNDFKEQVMKLDKNDHYKIYCRSGHRSGIALKKMKELGFSKMENLGSVENAKKILGE
jgi:phage shock protein E